MLLVSNRKATTSVTPGPPSRYGYVIVIASFIIVMMNVGMYFTTGVFFKPIAQDMGWTRAETSLPISLSILMTAVMSVVGGSLVDRYGPRKIAFIFAVLTGTGYLLMSQLSSLWQLYVYFGILVGIASSLMTPLLSLIPRWFSHSRTVMAGIISAGGGVGGLFMPLVANWLMTNSSWQRAYLVMGIVYLMVVLTAVQFLRYKPGVETAGSPGAARSVGMRGSAPAFSLKEAVKSRNYWLMAAMVSVFGYIANAINLHSAPHATDIGMTSTAAAGLLSIMNGFSIVGCIVLGLLGDRIGNQKMLLATFAIEAAVFFWLASITDLWMLNAFMIIYGVAFGSGLAQNAPLVARLFGTRSLGLILGTITFIQTVAAGLGGWVSGAIYDANQSYYWAFLTCGILGVLAVAATLSLRSETVKKSSATATIGK